MPDDRTMRERLERRLRARLSLFGINAAECAEAVDAILNELRNPTEAMVEAGESAASIGIGKPADDEALPRVWQAMIDVARQERG